MVLTSKGAAGITGAGLVTLTASLQAFGGDYFSAEAIAVGIALVVGIDRIMSEGRALTNAIGNSVAVMVIAKWQGELDEEQVPAATPALAATASSARPTTAGERGRSRIGPRLERVGSPDGARMALPPSAPAPRGRATGSERRSRGGPAPPLRLEPRDVLEPARVADLVARRRAGPWRASAGPCRHRRRPSSCRAAARRSRRRRGRGSCRS